MLLIYLINLIYPTFRILTHTIHINIYYHISTYIIRIFNYPIYQFHQRESMHPLLYPTLPSNPIILYPPLTHTKAQTPPDSWTEFENVIEEERGSSLKRGTSGFPTPNHATLISFTVKISAEHVRVNSSPKSKSRFTSRHSLVQVCINNITFKESSQQKNLLLLIFFLDCRRYRA